MYIWDKNVPLHEIQKEELCEDNIITWIFDGFTPTAKLINGKAYSIISDHIGTPLMAIDTQGNKVWERELDIYGKVRKEFTSDDVKDRRSGFMPFLYAGQYYDKETELAYNRFRYYDPNSGNYISQDPIGLEGGLALYSYVHDSNTWVDIFGLNELRDLVKEAHNNLDKFAQKRRVTAVGINEYGTLFVSSSTPKVDSKIVQWAEDNNITVVHSKSENVHAEEALIKSNNGIIAIEASSKICIDCQTLMEEKNIKFETETTGKKSKNRQAGCKYG
ncbi:RHS repeat domain-containing protein [Capnocytophaga canimorsus]|uniref:RHS repeat domain-containing protein n=1 Tax=Capnocytophaga canimorsus TaxID=28188 RepID=UPI0037D7ACBA